MTRLLLAALLSAAPAELVLLSPPPAAASGASGSIDPAAATRAYLDQLPAEQRARSDAYFEGGYWLQLWTFLWTAAVFILLLQTGLSARMRDLARRDEHRVRGLRHPRRAGADRAAVQQPEEAPGPARGRAHPLAGAGQRDRGRRGLGDRRLQTVEAREREHHRALRDRADHAQ